MRQISKNIIFILIVIQINKHYKQNNYLHSEAPSSLRDAAAPAVDA
jgi:hypothetical protein